MHAVAQMLTRLQHPARRGQPSAEQWFKQQVDASDHWTQIDALLQGISLAAGLGGTQQEVPAPSTAASPAQAEAQHQQPSSEQLQQKQNSQQQLQLISLAGLEHTLARLQVLRHTSPASMQDSDASWRACGSRLSSLMTLQAAGFEPSTSQPMPTAKRARAKHAHALEQAAAGSPSAAISALEAMAQLGTHFYCRPYADAVVGIMCNLMGESKPCDTHLTARCFAACASCGHLMRRSQVTLFSDVLTHQLGGLDAAGLAASLWAMTKYQVREAWCTDAVMVQDTLCRGACVFQIQRCELVLCTTVSVD